MNFPRNRPRHAARLGLTLIEVVVATATLTLTAGAIVGGMNFMAAVSERDRLRLDAIEVAHRMIQQQIEDPSLLSGQIKRAEMNGHYYSFTLQEFVLNSDEDGKITTGGRFKYKSKQSSEATGDERVKGKLNQLVARVYLDDDNTGVGGKAPLAELSRIYNWLRGDQDNLLRDLTRRFGEQLDKAGLGAPSGTTPPRGK